MSGIKFVDKKRGFTIVELLIVIVVIAILASISIVAYNGIQQRARDSERKSNISTLAKAFELYHIKYGVYPDSGGSSTVNGSWSTSNDSSWQLLANQLVPEFISKMPSDPTNSANGFTAGASYSYSYYDGQSSYCGAASRQMYIVVYRLESGAQENILNGDCPSNALGPYSGYSNYRQTK
tara:strand:- start:889 stop:1428 length:540 start_codon:yes stop_codon:yes gene_type:complete